MQNNIQYYYRILLYFLAGLLFIGALYDVVNNTIDLITIKITIIGTIIISILWLIIEIYSKKYGISWKSNGSKLKIKKVGLQVRFFIIGTIFSLWLPVIFNTKYNDIIVLEDKFDKRDSTNFKIALLPFKPDINCTELDIDYKGQILERLERKKEEENLSIKILPISGDTLFCPTSNDDARRIGESIFADMVIWGSYEENKDGLKALRIRYTIISDLNINNKLKTSDTEMQSINSLFQMREGYLQRDIDYVIYWVEAMNAYNHGLFNKSVEYFNNLVDYFSTDLYNIETFLILGQIYYEINYISNSLDFYFKALDLQKTIYDSTSNEVARTYSNIGSTYRLDGKYDKAIEYLKKAIEIQELAPNKLDLAYTYMTLGTTYIIKSEFENAINYLTKSLKIQLELNQFDAKLGRVYLNLGTVYGFQNNYLESITFYNKAIEIQKQVLDSYHPDLAKTYLNTGAAYSALGQYENALTNLNNALKIQLIILDPLSPDLSSTYLNLGSAYFNLNNSTKAIEYAKKCLSIRLKIFKEDHPQIATVYANLGAAYTLVPELDSAIYYFNKALLIQEKHLEYSNPELIGSYINIADIYCDNKDYRIALEYLKKAEDGISLHLGSDHLFVGYLRYTSAKVYYSLKKLDVAKKEINKSIIIFSIYFPKDQPDLKKALTLQKKIKDAIRMDSN